MTKIYVFGNPDLDEDSVAIKVSNQIIAQMSGDDLEFVFVKPNEDVPFAGQDLVVIMDAVEGIDEPKIFSENDLDKLVLAPRFSAHEYDLGMQLKYLRKIGQIKKVRIVGLPMSGDVKVEDVAKLLAGIDE